MDAAESRTIAWKRAALILLLAAAVLPAIINVLTRRVVSVEVTPSGNTLEITRIEALAGASNLALGDRIVAVNGGPVPRQDVLMWRIRQLRPSETLPLSIQRGDSEFVTIVSPQEPVSRLSVLPHLLSGLALLVLGVWVWWLNPSDRLTRAFLAVTALGGLSVLLMDQWSMYAPPYGSVAYAWLWISTYFMVPPALLRFIYLLMHQSRPAPVRNWMAWPLFAPFVALAVAMGVAFAFATATGSEKWIRLQSTLDRSFFGPLVAVYVIAALGILLYYALRPVVPWEKGRNRWLLITTVAAILPFVLLVRLPPAWGSAPLISTEIAMMMLLIAPISWAMAIASFHMLRVEWNLSRTIIYVSAAAVLAFLVGGVVSFLSNLEQSHQSLVWLLPSISIAVLLALALMTLVRLLRDWIDRLYFGDWFNLQRAVDTLAQRLSAAITENSIAAILTLELPSVLKISRAAVACVPVDMPAVSYTGGQPLHAADWENTLRHWVEDHPTVPGPVVERMADQSSLRAYGYELAVPLIYADVCQGWLFLSGKASGAPYGERDFRLLNTLSTVAGSALANGLLLKRLLEQERRVAAADLAGGIAHEVNNALYPLQGQTEVLEYLLETAPEAVPRDSLRTPIRILGEACRRIKRIASNLKRLSQPAALELRPVSLNDVAADAIALLRETAGRIKHFRDSEQGGGPVLCCDYCEHLPQTLADGQQLSQVFVNLLINAADTLEGRADGRLVVGTQVSADGQTITGFVEDNGAGIPSHLLAKIFQPYFTTKQEGRGSGLGLTLVRQIVEAHGGQVRIWSEVNQGTRVEFSLPVRSDAAAMQPHAVDSQMMNAEERRGD